MSDVLIRGSQLAIDYRRYNPINPPNQIADGQTLKLTALLNAGSVTTTASTAYIIPHPSAPPYPEGSFVYQWSVFGGAFTLTGNLLTHVFDGSTRTTVLSSTNSAPITAPAGASGVLGSGPSSRYYYYPDTTTDYFMINARWSVTQYGTDAEVCLSTHIGSSLEDENYVCWTVNTAGIIKRFRTKGFTGYVEF